MSNLIGPINDLFHDYGGMTRMRDLRVDHKTLPVWVLATASPTIPGGEAPVYLTVEPFRVLLFTSEARALRFRNLFDQVDPLGASWPRQTTIAELIAVFANDDATVDYYMLDPKAEDVSGNIPKGKPGR